MTDEQVEPPRRCGRPPGSALDDLAVRPVPDLADVDAPRAPRRRRRRRLAAICSADRHERASHTYGKSYRDVVRAFARPARPPARPRRPPHDRGRGRRPPRLVRRRRHRRHPLRRRLVGGRRRRGRRRRRLRRRRVSIDLTAPRPGARDRPRVAGGPHPGRRARPGARGPAPPPRLHAAPLPAVLRVLDPRRLARHPLRRPLRQRLHPHRRPGRVACGSSRRPASSESRRLPGSGAGPSPDRLFLGSRGRARHHHRGVDAHAGPARSSRARPACASPTTTTRSRRPAPSPSRRCSPPTAGCSTPARPLLSAGVDDGSHLLVLGLRVGRPPGRRLDRPGRRARPRPRRHRARRHHASAAPDRRPTPQRGAGRDGAVGAWRNASSGRPTPATRWCG